MSYKHIRAFKLVCWSYSFLWRKVGETVVVYFKRLCL